MRLNYNRHDAQIWEEELDDFVPQRVFDAHAHLVKREHSPANNEWGEFWGDALHSDHRRWAARLYPKRSIHYLFLGTPIPGIQVARHNQFIVDQLRTDPLSRANLLVTPDRSVKEIETEVRQRGVIGLKPYRLFSKRNNPHTCRIREFLPEPQLELANELGLWITMHLSRYSAAADPANMRDLTEYTEKRYPRIKWILAHCARSFTYWPIREAVNRLRDLPNIYYDLSAVCDVRPILTLFKHENVARIFFGSDGIRPTFVRGGYFALGRAWLLIRGEQYGARDFPHCDGRPILAIYENLLAIKQAAEFAELSRHQVEAIFWGNAAREFLGRKT
jgi:hypothetical protein